MHARTYFGIATHALRGFVRTQTLPPPCISVMNVTFGYEDGKWLYENLNFGIDCDSRVAIVGPNGAGYVSVYFVVV